MSDIPEGRRLLLLLADTAPALLAAEIRNIVHQHLIRRAPVRRAATKSKAVTPAIAKAIRHMAKTYPDMHEADIAARFGVNQGRVSEVLTGEPRDA